MDCIYELNNYISDKRFSISLCSIGSILTMVGITMFFEPTLIKIGNVLMCTATLLFIGPMNVVDFLIVPERMKISCYLGLGFTFILYERPIPGLFFEGLGLFRLGSDMYPFVWRVIKQAHSNKGVYWLD